MNNKNLKKYLKCTIVCEDNEDLKITMEIPLTEGVTNYYVAVDWDNEVAFFDEEEANRHILRTYNDEIDSYEDFREAYGFPRFKNEEEESDFYAIYENEISEALESLGALTFTNYQIQLLNDVTMEYNVEELW